MLQRYLRNKLKKVELEIEKKNEQVKKLESDIEELHLKFAEQNHILNKINKKLNILKEKEDKIAILEEKINLIEKTSTQHIPENNKAVTSKMDTSPENQIENKCEQCDFIAKNDQGLKVHIKAKHTEKKKFKCWVCDFSSETKSELTDHNDIYWDSHRITFYPEKKKYYLKEMEQLRNDGFTVKEKFYNQVMNCED